VPGLRGNPARSYPRAQIDAHFPGAFESYVASLIAHWADSDEDRLTLLIWNLRHIGIASYLRSERIDDTRIELQVARLPTGERFNNIDLVNIVDVGFGVSQALPVLTALIAANPGQLVCIAQPELHLHPRAQSRMADILVNAARRGVRVVVETHSDLLLRGVQTAIAKGDIEPVDSRSAGAPGALRGTTRPKRGPGSQSGCGAHQGCLSDRGIQCLRQGAHQFPRQQDARASSGLRGVGAGDSRRRLGEPGQRRGNAA
jgi:hypothetical protein